MNYVYFYYAIRTDEYNNVLSDESGIVTIDHKIVTTESIKQLRESLITQMNIIPGQKLTIVNFNFLHEVENVNTL